MGMDCRKIEQLISPYMDGELAPVEAGAVRSHLSVCAACRQEYENLVLLSASLKQMGEVLIPAPIGFKDALMQRISEESVKEERVISPVKTSHWFTKSWRRAAASAAAVMLLIFGAVSANSGPLIQLANRTPAVHQLDNSSGEVKNNPANNITPVQIGSSGAATTSGTTQTDNNNPTVDSTPTVNSIRSNPVFLNKERAIVTTMLKVKVSESSSALEKALIMADNVQAQTQNLGQQIDENGSYTALKITVAKSAAYDLINNLSSLGTVSSQEVDKKDISTRYAETLSQYQMLVTQRATLQDDSQKAQLDQRIGTLEDELRDWEQKAEQETIVLWLEK